MEFEKVVKERFSARKFKNDLIDMDACIVATHMMLEATNLGVDNIWIEMFDKDILKQEFNLSENIEPICLISLGYKTDDCKPSPMHSSRRDLSEIVEYK